MWVIDNKGVTHCLCVQLQPLFHRQSNIRARSRRRGVPKYPAALLAEAGLGTATVKHCNMPHIEEVLDLYSHFVTVLQYCARTLCKAKIHDWHSPRGGREAVFWLSTTLS